MNEETMLPFKEIKDMFITLQESSIQGLANRVEQLERSRSRPSTPIPETPAVPREEKPPGLSTVLKRQGISDYDPEDEDSSAEGPLRAASRRLDAPPLRTSISGGPTFTLTAPTISNTLKHLNLNVSEVLSFHKGFGESSVEAFEPLANLPSFVSPLIIPLSVFVYPVLVSIFRFNLEKQVAVSAFSFAEFVAAMRPEDKPNICLDSGLMFVGLKFSLKVNVTEGEKGR